MSAGEKTAARLDLAVFTPYRMVVLARMMSERLGALYQDQDITIPEWRVLAVISQAASVAARDVVARTPMDKMAVSRAVASLQSKGLIARSPAVDRRVSSLRLSPKGRALFDRVSAIALAYEESVLRALSAEQRRAFLDALTILESAKECAQPDGAPRRSAE